MPNVIEALQPTLEGAAMRAVFALPQPIRRLIAGAPIRIDGQELALDAQLLLKLQKLTGQTGLAASTAEKARAGMAHATKITAVAPLGGVVVAERTIPTDNGDLPARLYRPQDLTETGPLLVFYHGGGWVIGDLDSHDDLCRFLAKHAGIRVLSVDYRLAPEYPFPAALDDALAAYSYAVNNAADLGSSSDAIAVGGDSAGGNLAAAVALQTTRSGEQKPVMQLLLYPAVDATRRRRSRELFGNGFLLTDHDMTWFMDQYSPVESERGDPRLSVLLADDLTELPTAYVVTCGFDPLRDEGEAYAKALSDAGVPVVARRFPDLIHGFANIRPVGHRFEEALFEIVGTVRAALDLRKV
ncbi:alpha/beta hydrolase [Saccharopolyspora terrae]|jgi:acetyl esterase|uniref:Alpha/beta hydrolase n=1 Tax=Saccharopolyspora terrae TaxID=2530384 RepID=A0A4R4VZV9_9PSEU|nr:alpha/beta hydrolase [Saccharopolyspora terrae]TDD08145.1 alpha/beta hydrolase [Saccharopolyspora terrae]